MGNTLFQAAPALQNLLQPNNLEKGLPLQRSGPAAAARPPDHAPAVGPPARHGMAASDSLSFEMTRFFEQVQRMSMSIQGWQGSTSGEDGTASAVAQQLQFDFFAETRQTEMVQFQSRTANVAEGLEGTRRSSYIEVSQQVAMRFEFSMSISGAALGGFANASEALQDMDALFDKMISFSQELLAAADEMFNEFLSQFSGISTEVGDSFQTMFDNMINEFMNNGFMEDFLGAYSGEGATEGAAAVEMQMEFQFSFSASMSMEVEVRESDPIMLDLDGDGFELTSHLQGAQFDILGAGRAANTAFVTGGDAFLALDRNENGVVDSGKELFGDQHGAANGYEELRKLDSNGDGRINNKDEQFDALRLFRDNGNGRTEAGELISLRDAGIKEIQLDYRNVDESAAGGNRLAQRAAFLREDGSKGNAADAILNFTV